MILRKSLPALWLTGGISAITILSAAPARANIATLFDTPPTYAAIPGQTSDYSLPSWHETLPWTWDDKEKELFPSVPAISIVSVWNTAIGGPTNAFGPGANAQGGSTGTFKENGSQGGSTGAFGAGNAQGGLTGSSDGVTTPFAPDDALGDGTTGSFTPDSITSTTSGSFTPASITDNTTTGPFAPDSITDNGTAEGFWPQDTQDESAAPDLGSYDPVHQFLYNLYSFFSFIGSLGLQSLQSTQPTGAAGNS
ncbi:hypothetical protein MXD59_17245 [Frankia sp. Ag45/Mut15]|uniref:Uncharacterized protein n=1 Tax=Frankia umida TaxID=573489 RepID=A0ABT0K1Y5_9ACTN|nr:hypothetical protein [Frankia umida]MCK9877497.1 hypothetical protein [Frankia umida]